MAAGSRLICSFSGWAGGLCAHILGAKGFSRWPQGMGGVTGLVVKKRMFFQKVFSGQEVGKLV